MDPLTITWIGIAVLFVAIILTLLGYAIYSGLLDDVVVTTGKPRVGKLTFAYKFAHGPYKESGSLFTEACSLAPSLRSIGIYYDDPKTVPAEKLRYAVGCILAEGIQQLDPLVVKMFTDHKYKISSFPAAQTVVHTTFPFKGMLSVIIGIRRVYSALTSYLEEKRLVACPWLEIYGGGLIYFMAVLDKDDNGEFLKDFFIPEALEEESKNETPKP